MSEETEKIPFIKSDALVPIVLDTAMIGILQRLMTRMFSEKNEKDIADMEQAIKDGTVDPETWMGEHLALLHLLRLIDDSAVQNNLVDYQTPSS